MSYFSRENYFCKHKPKHRNSVQIIHCFLLCVVLVETLNVKPFGQPGKEAWSACDTNKLARLV